MDTVAFSTFLHFTCIGCIYVLETRTLVSLRDQNSFKITDSYIKLVLSKLVKSNPLFLLCQFENMLTREGLKLINRNVNIRNTSLKLKPIRISQLRIHNILPIDTLKTSKEIEKSICGSYSFVFQIHKIDMF